MKKVLTTGIAAMAIAAAAGAMTLSEANGKLAEAAEGDGHAVIDQGGRLPGGDKLGHKNGLLSFGDGKKA